VGLFQTTVRLFAKLGTLQISYCITLCIINYLERYTIQKYDYEMVRG